MAVKTTRELYEFLDGTQDFSITAEDVNHNTQTIISSANSVRYIKRKYGDRRYCLLTGQNIPTLSEMYEEFAQDFRLWVLNRQHNINRMYQTLVDHDYNPIENYNRTEVETNIGSDEITFGKRETTNGTDTTTYGKTNTESGTDTTNYGKVDTLSGTDSLQHGKTITSSGTDTTEDSGDDSVIDSGNENKEIQKAGFNSPNTYTPDTKETTTFGNRKSKTEYGKITETDYGKVETNSGTDSTRYGKTDTLSGSDSIRYGKTETLSGSDSITRNSTVTDSGSNSTETENERNTHAFGNIGVTTNQKMATEEIRLRQISLAEMLIDNFINDYTFYS